VTRQIALGLADGVDTARDGAHLSEDGRYRLALWRVWDAALPRVLFVMLNPSTADAWEDDPTIRACKSFARRWGFGSLEVVNLFAYRATHPEALFEAYFRHPVDGPPGNRGVTDRWIERAALRSKRIVAAWGSHEIIGRTDRDREVLAILRRASCRSVSDIYALGITKEGYPRHPLYIKRDTEPFFYRTGRAQVEDDV
jgi:hypothetical protein